MSEHNHERFFPFEELTPCKRKSCVGGKCSEDKSKVICGLDELQKQKDRCIVYSIGGNNEWKFERKMLKRTPCEIHTFDCTGPRSRFKVPEQTEGRLHFHHVCVSPYPQDPNEATRPARMVGESWTLLEMQQKLGHKRIDLLKIDVEGFEFPLFASWPELIYENESENILLPMQILVEVRSMMFCEAIGQIFGSRLSFQYFFFCLLVCYATNRYITKRTFQRCIPMETISKRRQICWNSKAI
jgi:hypothetical protein